RLATGVKRHALPADYRFVEIFKQLGAGTSAFAPQALQALATTFENRQQRDTAASVWKELRDRFGKEEQWRLVAEARLEQIESALGKLDSVDNQPAGKNARVDLTFRNADTVNLTARPVKVVELLEAIKTEYKDRAAGKKGRERNEWTWLHQTFGSVLNSSASLKTSDAKRFLGEQVGAWETGLKPAPRHADRRITLETTLSKAGVYFIEATFAGGGRAQCLVEITDLVMLTKPLLGDSGTRGFVMDALTGRPVPKAVVNAFGYRNQYTNDGNRSKEVWFTREERFNSDDDGSYVLKSDDNLSYNWMLQAQAPDGRMAFIGFNQFYRNYRNQVQDGQQLRLYITTDRPVYRPAQKVHLAAWARRATYQEGKSGNEFAGKRFTCHISDPRGEKLLEQQVVVDQYGALSLDLDLGENAALGVYNISISDNRNLAGNLTFRVEEYKKPEFEVKVKTPEKPVLLGEPFTATVEAKYYFGGAVTEAKVHYKVERTRHDANWFPIRPWDWLYGPGYWWHNNEYAWLPGFSGCISFWPTWWNRQMDPPEVVA
ncbi:MAG TPA: MG2 domain-containing protein, partial [Verrucomicrobium sp.]|nr:MG2 domain-containing protein [Verrucomicrobium sp.]